MYILIISPTSFIVKLCTDGVTIVDASKKSEELLLLSTLIASDFKYGLRS